MSILKFKEDGVFKSVLAIKGEAGVGITSITKTGTQGKVDTYTILFTDGTTTTFTVTNGQDGTGTGDMTKAVYDTNNNGKVDEAEAVAWSGVTGKPSTFTPSSHAHTKSEVTDFSHTHTKSDVTDFPTLADVATSGSYNDLSNKPTIPSEVTESTVSGWGFTKNTGTYIKPSDGIPDSDLAEAHYTESEIDTLLAGKASSTHTHSASDITNLNSTSIYAVRQTKLVSSETTPSTNGQISWTYE